MEVVETVVAMFNSVETRPPFLDEDVITFAASIHPDYKHRLQQFRRLRLASKRIIAAT